ncbi:hypothetical protein [Streptomyces liangshanensis]|uniref:hypothetical protein n=1 Tax=Streptomyces liangshanensis TaxID=2717324 RepID=UPI0036DD1CC7
MSIPATAHAVQHNVFFYNGDTAHPGVPHIELQFTTEISLPDADTSPEMRVLTDQAAAAAALAFASTIETAYPGVPGGPGRVYLCREAGDPWPPTSP